MSRTRIISIGKVYSEVFNTYGRAKKAENLDVQIRALELMAEIAMYMSNDKEWQMSMERAREMARERTRRRAVEKTAS